jgi:hypothetical protein
MRTGFGYLSQTVAERDRCRMTDEYCSRSRTRVTHQSDVERSHQLHLLWSPGLQSLGTLDTLAMAGNR